MVSRLAESQVDQRDGGLSAGRDEGVVRAFEVGDAGGEFARGGRAVEAVGVAELGLAPAVTDLGLRREDDGRATMVGAASDLNSCETSTAGWMSFVRQCIPDMRTQGQKAPLIEGRRPLHKVEVLRALDHSDA